MISFETAKYFSIGLISIIMLLSLVKLYDWQNKDAKEIILENKSNYTFLIFSCIILCLLLGFRPVDKFGDTANYAIRYFIYQQGDIPVTNPDEWVFDFLMAWFAQRYDVSIFFTFIMFLYVFLAMAGLYRLFKNNTSPAMLFFLGAFSFFAYATNGIRNGLACSIIILAFSFLITPKKNWMPGVLLCFVAFFIHRSTALPILCLGASFFFKSLKPVILFWFFSIFLNVFFSTPIEEFFANLGFDDRLTSYIEDSDEYAARGFKSGFRFDFLLYSFMPILLGWYIVGRKMIKIDNTYRLLLSTYILANSFWVMLMNAAFSNRFAYLSWFLYPLVIAYPCLRENIWQDRQGKMAGLILVAHSGFTFFMKLFYYDPI